MFQFSRGTWIEVKSASTYALMGRSQSFYVGDKQTGDTIGEHNY